MACLNTPLAGADVAVSNGQGTRLEAYPDCIDIMQDMPGESVRIIQVRWDDLPKLRRALDEMEAAHRAYEATNGGHEE